MFAQVDTRVPGEVEREVAAIHRRLFPRGERAYVMRAFEWATLCFGGFYEGYQAIDARYHDFEHTLQGTLCFARLIEGRDNAGVSPKIPEKMFALGLLAILFHDTGYLKKCGDNEGTGAKYTLVHVARSAEFAREFLRRQDYAADDIAIVQRMISCTGVNADLADIPFHSEIERTLGFALATADLLGQMAARDYVDKLPILFSEFAEAAQSGGEKAARFAVYRNAEDLMRGTAGFWRNYVLPKIERDFLGLYRFLNDPFPDGPNDYLRRIEANLDRLRQRLDSASLRPQP
jgi:hypothetical protein